MGQPLLQVGQRRRGEVVGGRVGGDAPAGVGVGDGQLDERPLVGREPAALGADEQADQAGDAVGALGERVGAVAVVLLRRRAAAPAG